MASATVNPPRKRGRPRKYPAPDTQLALPEIPDSDFPPPGRVNRGEHGYQGGRLVVKTGVDALRDTLKLTDDVPVAAVCEDAARLIADLRRGKGVRCPNCSE